MIQVLLPWIQAALGLASLWQAFQRPRTPAPPPKPPTLGWDEAMRRATETLTPIYDERLQKTLEGVDKELIARGFFGQLPGAALAGARATDLERAKVAAIAALGAQMQSQSEEQALAQQRLAAEWAMNQSSLWNQLQNMRLQTLGNLFNTALYYPLQYYERTFQWPWDRSGTNSATPMSELTATKLGTQYYSSAEGAPAVGLGGIPGYGLKLTPPTPQDVPVLGKPSSPSGFSPGGLTLKEYIEPWTYSP